MQCKLIRDTTRKNPNYSARDHERCRKTGKRYGIACSLPVPSGEVIDHPQAYRLVQMGMAVPHDDECANAANMTTGQMQAAQEAQDRLSHGRATGDTFYDTEGESESDAN